ncbi:MAG: carbohydrate kinase family protein [Brotaphodocola sp.]
MDILCIGAAVMDITGWPIDQKKEWKEKQRISEIRIQPGGDAVNQSIHMAALGFHPGLAACVGADTNGRILKSALDGMGIDTAWVKEKGSCATGAAMVLVSEDGERRVFSVKGAHSMICRDDIPWELPEECWAVSLASIFSLPELERDGLLEFLKMVKGQGKLVFADLAADKLGLGLDGIKRFLPYIDYFIPSLYDVLSMTGTDKPQAAAQVFHVLGVPHVIIKCGEKGCYCSSEEYEGWIPAIPVQPVDTTGAGDCMSAVFACRILSGDSVEAACRYACAAASYSTLFAGASGVVLRNDVVREFMKTYE